jgi:metal-responsive CopG/Arc/MetJ family transcriptional regulator
MTNTIVSIRIPESLLDELKVTAKKEHYLDVSEAVRSIIRNEWIKNKNPLAFQIKKLEKNISQNIKSSSQKEIIAELKKIASKIERENE